MPGIISSNVVIMYPEQLTEEQVKLILGQSLEEHKVINRSLGGLDIEFDPDGTTLVIRSWERSPVKRIRRIPNYMPVEKEVQVASDIPQVQVLLNSAESSTAVEPITDGMITRLRSKFKGK